MKCYIIGASRFGTACAVYLKDTGYSVLLAELPEPTAHCRMKSFAQTVFSGRFSVEGYTSVLCKSDAEVSLEQDRGCIPIVIEAFPDYFFKAFYPDFCINTTQNAFRLKNLITLKHGRSGIDCDLVVQCGGRKLGSIVPQPELFETEIVGGFAEERFVVCEMAGRFVAKRGIGECVKQGETLGFVEIVDKDVQAFKKQECLTLRASTSPRNCSCSYFVRRVPVYAKIAGTVLGLVGNIQVQPLMTLAEIDPTGNNQFCYQIDATSRCIAGAVLRESIKFLRQDSYYDVAKSRFPLQQ